MVRVVCPSSGCWSHLIATSEKCIIDLGYNDLACGGTIVADVADDALRFLALVDNDVHTKMIILLSVIQRTSVSNRDGMTVSTFNHRVKAFNSRIAACVHQLANVRTLAQSRLNFPRYISDDGCHLTEEGQARYAKGLRQAVLKLSAPMLNLTNPMLAPSGDRAVPALSGFCVGICLHCTVTTMLAPNGDRAVPALSIFVVKEGQ